MVSCPIPWRGGRRTIGVRMALGAGYREVVRLLLSSALATTAAGVLVGIAMALALGRFLEALLYGTASYDLGVFVVATTVISAVALLATRPGAGPPRPADRPVQRSTVN